MSKTDDTLTGRIIEIQRLSTEDGPGIRTTVFMKGCTMHCLWCHNPESISSAPQLQWIDSRCIGCKTCLKHCNRSALDIDPGGMQIDRLKCQGCGDCARECPTNALELIGKMWSVSDLVKEISKDRSFFMSSGGGITISGGESTLQYHYVTEVLKRFKQAGFHTALDTCGLTSQTALASILPFVDLVLFDLKEMDSTRHLEYTGSSLQIVLSSLVFICETIRESGKGTDLWIRTPIIPGTTARPENVQAIGAYIQNHCLDVVTRWDLLAFNNLCKDKYKRLETKWFFEDAPLISESEKELLLQAASDSISNHAIIHWGGNTRLETETANIRNGEQMVVSQ
ncbi:glycyl-radical enzyme activating protein [bacterium]|nr:glycyl-radical enzyme activating protein [bacterium]